MTRLQIFKYLVILIIGLLVSLYLFYSINDKYSERNRGNIENATTKAQLKIIEEISKIDLVIESMGFFFENTSEINPVLFTRFTDPFMDDLFGIKSLGWAPKILDAKKQQYLTEAEENLEGITMITEVDSTDQLVVTEKGKVYFPTTFINPMDSHLEIMGFNVYSDSTRRAVIDNTIGSKKIAFSPPIELIPQSGGGIGFLVVRSVFNRKSENVKGIVMGLYRMDEFIEKTLATELKTLDIDIYDKGEGTLFLYSSRGDRNYENITDDTIETEIKVGDRIWGVNFTPSPKFLAYPHVFESYVALFLTLIATFLLILMIRRRDYYYSTLEEKVRLRTAELEESNKLKENLLREIHHRVKNNLQITSSLMNMQKRKLSSKEAITALENSQARISAIALTHQKIYQDKDSKAVNLCEYLGDLMAYQKRMAHSFEYKIKCPDLSIDLDKAVPLALIISELVTNAIKHAYAETAEVNELKITVKCLDNDEVALSIKDNGGGLPEDFNINKAKGIGFEIIRALCRQIDAKLTYNSDEGGTCFTVTFSNKAKLKATSVF